MPASTPYVPTVFISYQTRTHRRYLPEIISVLKEEGIGIWVDENERPPPTKVQGLEWALVGGLESADVLLLLTPSGPRQLTFQQSIREVLDFIGSTLSAQGHGGQVTAYWGYFWFKVKVYRYFYGIDLVPKHEESWQSWEARVGETVGLKIIRITITEDEILSQSDGSSLVYSAQALAEGLRRGVIPQLRDVPPRPKPEMLPGPRAFLDACRSLGLKIVRLAIWIAVVIGLILLATLIWCFVRFPVETTLVVVALITCFCALAVWKRRRGSISRRS